MTIARLLPLAALLLAALLPLASAQALDIEGVHLDDRVEQAGKSLLLNGAGVRSKFFFDIYVGALYLREAEHRAERILPEPSPARVVMHILYEQVEAEKLVHGWQTGFEKNLDALQMQAVQQRLLAFNRLFGDVRRGDVLYFDFLADGSTQIVMNGALKGAVPGVDFQRALISVWLGEHPADTSLKQGMLGSD